MGKSGYHSGNRTASEKLPLRLSDQFHAAVTIAAMSARIGPKKPVRVYLPAWREHFGLTQQQVGDRIAGGIDKGTVSRWERAKRVPSVNVLAAYAEALDIPVSRLFRRPEERQSLDEAVADAPKEVRDQVEEMVKILLRAG